jgi:CheY-like chemotaxis protein/2-polyprenyl-3-methyl-5-hydroxy-6-metoxy-1,4-benzoquinol methylase
LRVLLVDDEVGFTEVLAKRLRRRGLTVSVAQSGAEGLRQLRESDFDVAVLDLKMVDMDGIEVLKVFKKMVPAMPVVMLTGHGSEEAAKDGLKAGAADYLLKPCAIDELLEKLTAAVARAASADTGEANAFDLRAASWDANPHRRKMTRDIVAAMDEERVFADAASALDFGCGTGLLTLALAERVPWVTGLDTSPGMLAELSAKIARAGLGNVGTLLADLARGDKVPGRFDLVASAMALHHVEFLDVVLPRLFELTTPGGRLAVADLDAEDGSFHEGGPTAFHTGFDRQALMAGLEKAGWTDLRARTAASLDKPGTDGSLRSYTIFLMTGRRERR